jgi:hypothetical protein
VPDAAGRRRDARRAAASKARGPVPGPSGVDTGLGAVLAVDPDGLAEGAATPWPGTEPTERHPARRTVPRAKARKPRAAE